MSTEPTVWILGAGFSRSLGGRLLGDLFRPGTPGEESVFFPADQYGDLGTARYVVSATYTIGKGEQLWEDAEEFLAKVDEAWRGGRSSLKTKIHNVISRAYPHASGGQRGWPTRNTFLMFSPEFDRAARRALAAECAAFLLEDDTTSELWSPYKHWAESLLPRCDTVVSFNYDLVPDRLSKFAPALQVLVPGEEYSRDKVLVLKLHGSIDWVDRDGVCSRSDFKEICRDPKTAVAIAAPGRSKLDQVQKMFEPLWELAEAALKTAKKVVFLGYSFPRTDALARGRILSAIRSGKEFAQIDLVLGPPDVSQAVAARIAELLVSCAGGRAVSIGEKLVRGGISHKGGAVFVRINRSPLWAEDYIQIYEELGWPLERG